MGQELADAIVAIIERALNNTEPNPEALEVAQLVKYKLDEVMNEVRFKSRRQWHVIEGAAFEYCLSCEKMLVAKLPTGRTFIVFYA